jgi:hypothetical protein
MDILNFISWIRGRRQVTSVDPAKSLLPVGLKDGRRDDEYLAGAISVQDFTAQVASVIPSGAQGPAGPQGVPGPVGPAGLNWQGAWSASGTYVVDDAVGYGGASWFCIDPVGPTATTPDSDPTNWALLASQGATGPQGPQGIQGVQGPSGSGLPGTVISQTQWWTGSSWAPSTGLSHNGMGNVGINSTPSTAYRLYINATTGNAIRMQNTTAGSGIFNLMQTATTTFQWGINPPSHPIPNSVYFTTNGSQAIKFATSFADRMLITAGGDVYIGATTVTNPERLSVAGGNIFITDVGSGLVTYSPDGTKYKITVDNTGTVIATPYP